MRVILIIEIENLRILYFVNVKRPQITNSRKSKHAKITRSTIYMVNLPSAEYTRLPNTHVSRLPSASASTEYTKPKQRVVVEGVESSWLDISSGMPQGTWDLCYFCYLLMICLRLQALVS